MWCFRTTPYSRPKRCAALYTRECTLWPPGILSLRISFAADALLAKTTLAPLTRTSLAQSRFRRPRHTLTLFPPLSRAKHRLSAR